MKREMGLKERKIKYDLFCTECEQLLALEEESKLTGCLNPFLVVVGFMMGGITRPNHDCVFNCIIKKTLQ